MSWGIDIIASRNNFICGNIIDSVGEGIHVYSSTQGNVIKGNTLINNKWGIWLSELEGGHSIRNNTICYNNFINNNCPTYIHTEGTNLWDDGLGKGNYWSDYNGTDIDGDSVGDTDLPWQDVDHYPLTNPWTLIEGDINYDGTVNLFDLVTIGVAYNTKPGDADWNPLANLAKDWKIDIFDLTTFAANYGHVSYFP
jgi:parallel beta-helix repeat protein